MTLTDTENALLETVDIEFAVDPAFANLKGPGAGEWILLAVVRPKGEHLPRTMAIDCTVTYEIPHGTPQQDMALDWEILVPGRNDARNSGSNNHQAPHNTTSPFVRQLITGKIPAERTTSIWLRLKGTWGPQDLTVKVTQVAGAISYFR